jgi:plastocyanin
MDTLDSRCLRYTDCFAQKFSHLGGISYRLATAAGACLRVEKDDKDVFTIDVAERGDPAKSGQQHDVTVRQEGNRLLADPPHIKIKAGDVVMWNAPNPATPGYNVRGEGAGFTFDSAEMTSEAIYTHAFGTPGTYRWTDAIGGTVSGVVEVQSVDAAKREDCEKWLAALGNGTLIHIVGDEAKPDSVQIMPGQTVFWAVERASGVCITDERLIPQARQPAAR